MSGEKTEKPTPKKIKDARKEGQVAHSKEVVSAALLFGTTAYFMMMGEHILETLKDLIILPSQFYNTEFQVALQEVGGAILREGIILLLPLLLLVVVIGIFANVIHVGPLFAVKSITPDIKKINPISGFKKIFAMKNLVEFIKSVIKIIFLSSLIYFAILRHLSDMLSVYYCGLGCIAPIVGKMLIELFLYSCLAFIIIAVLDLAYQKYEHQKSLKMSMEEIKKEYKETEGNPEIKGKRKEIHKELLEDDIGTRTKKGSAVITNPTHIAIVIYYEKEVTQLPVVSLMAENQLAQKIKRIAAEEGIPMMENRPLARALLASAKEGEYITREFIEPVAEVLRWANSVRDSENTKSLE